jgi:hypothetical protein
VSGGGLTWTKSVINATSPPAFYHQTLDFWWAPASSKLSSAAITVTASGVTFDAMAVSWASFSGANLTSPFDPNPSLPSKGLTSVNGPLVTTISTTDSNTTILLCMGTESESLTPPNVITPIVGSLINQANEAAGTFWADTWLGQYQVSSPQSGLTVGITQTNMECVAWIVVALASGAASPGQNFLAAGPI